MENHAEEQTESECSFKFHDFMIDIGTTYACHTIKMDNCLYLWVGNPRKQIMNDLSFAIVSPFAKEPLTTKIMGPISDETSSNFAKRLSKKLSKPVYVSFNVEVDNPSMRALEMKLKDELAAHPEAF
ncbi:proteasome assembly chaperone 4 [Halictus rubicundus]|uniref:proteasome assembly chaperone 4 n=1 Tax=Halictus rubicundus TaxID=77578 RepID=UPI00403598B9